MSTTSVFEITSDSAAEYLQSQARIAVDRVSPLSGGVSNTVLLVQSPAGAFVLKQSLPQLRVEQEWFCDRSRIFRESAAMRLLEPLLPPLSVPKVVFEDRDNFAFLMTASPSGSETWKSQLLRGELQPRRARQAGELLAAIIRASLHDQRSAEVFGDIEAFRQLRLEPYYELAARRNPHVTEFLMGLIRDCMNRKVSLVHGDWSPKNILAGGESLTAIDWECVHFGNPAFDAAFGLNHLLLKSFHMPGRMADFAALGAEFWKSLTGNLPELPWFYESTLRHWSGLLLARIDGKSPVEYITSQDLRNRIRDFALNLIAEPASSIEEVFDRRARWR